MSRHGNEDATNTIMHSDDRDASFPFKRFFSAATRERSPETNDARGSIDPLGNKLKASERKIEREKERERERDGESTGP